MNAILIAKKPTPQLMLDRKRYAEEIQKAKEKNDEWALRKYLTLYAEALAVCLERQEKKRATP